METELAKNQSGLMCNCMSTNTTNTIKSDEFRKLLEKEDIIKIPKINDTVSGTVISASKHEVRVDLGGIAIGVVRGPELYHEAPEYSRLKLGDSVEATVVELENENGEVELSFRFAGHKKTWDDLRVKCDQGVIVKAQVLDANKGGLLVKIGHIAGFLPVSQLTSEHYPRVPGGDKNKILEHIKQFVNKIFDVKIIDVDPKEEKLIVSEKEAWEESQHSIASHYKIGDTVEGKITAITDFGVFLEFGDTEKLEGLIHISELAWQRIDHPKEVVRSGERIKAEIINIEGSKIFLSMKKLKADPWVHVGERYQVGQVVRGKILKLNPFGLFVELDPEIHGLAHVSELSEKPVNTLDEVAVPGTILDFKIISIEPREHRLGLSLKQSTTTSTPETESGIPEEMNKTQTPVQIDETNAPVDEKPITENV